MMWMARIGRKPSKDFLLVRFGVGGVGKFYGSERNPRNEKVRATLQACKVQGERQGGGDQTHPGVVGIFDWSSDGLTAS